MKHLVSLLVLLLVMASCKDSKALSPQEQFGNNAHYFMGLSSLQKGLQEEAISHFKKGVKKSDDFFSQRCLAELCELGSPDERMAAAQEMARRFPSDAGTLRLAQALHSAEDYEHVISVTAGNAGSESAELVYLRLLALSEKGKHGFAGEIEDWFFHEPITGFHKKYFDSYKDTVISPLFPEETIQCMRIRLAVHQRDYGQAFSLLAEVLRGQGNPSQWLVRQPEQMLSDIGKTFLYGTPHLTEAAQFFDSALQATDKDTPSFVPFYLNFYAGRLYDKGLGTGNTKALKNFEAAMEASPSPANYDNALWYYLSAQLKISPDDAEDALEKYGGTMHDAFYYSDFFETMILRYFAERDWNGVLNGFVLIKDCADQETLSRYAYLSGRLVQLGLMDLDDFPAATLQEIIDAKEQVHGHEAQDEETPNPSEELAEPGSESPQKNDSHPLKEAVAKGLFTVAYQAGGDLYYRLLAAIQLDYSPAVMRQTLYKTKVLEDFALDPNVETLLEGLMLFDLPEHIYPVWREHSTSVSLEMAQKAASFLSMYGIPRYSAQGLRLMANAIFHADSQTTREMYHLAYPRLYSQEIAAAAKEYNLPEHLIYGLIRSESFFDAEVSSYAGAVGLAQLMPATAGDIARKLKVQEYELTDPATSVRFGSFYLAELIGRLEGSTIEALYSYNAGITNVRRWKKFFPDLPEDLILELIPFAETRNYGKKIVVAAAIYGDLYFEIPHRTVIEQIVFQ